jgi:hypothetical protein
MAFSRKEQAGCAQERQGDLNVDGTGAVGALAKWRRAGMNENRARPAHI